ncbi:MAG TPA: DUF2868 domain-containing protein [Methylomirabilota bacterium]
MTVPPRMSEADARTLLLIQAVEDTDQGGVLLAPPRRTEATRRAFDDGSDPTDDLARLSTRAALLRDDVLREAPDLGRVLAPPRWRGPLVLGTLAAAALAGALTNLLGPERHVSVLAFPLAGILLWNLAVYAALLVRTLAHAAARGRRAGPVAGRLALAARWLEGAWLGGLVRRLGGSTRSAAVADAVRRFQRLWLPAAAPLIAARLRVVLHLAALATALGAVAGMYVSGIALDYRATWESTWLSAPAVQRSLDLVLGPAARVLGIAVPDVEPLRGPAGEGSAAPWIHLWGATLGLFVGVPRAALALGEALIAARLARGLPLQVDPAYARRALQSGRGAATLVEIVYYSCTPDPGLRERLHARLQEEVGARAVIHDGACLAYGDDPERIGLPADAARTAVVALVFALAQTPEPEVHGEFVERLRERLDRGGWRLLVVLDTVTYRQRVGAEARVRERRATWERLLRDLQLTAIELT